MQNETEPETSVQESNPMRTPLVGLFQSRGWLARFLFNMVVKVCSSRNDHSNKQNYSGMNGKLIQFSSAATGIQVYQLQAYGAQEMP